MCDISFEIYFIFMNFLKGRDCFLSSFYLKSYEEIRGGIVVAGKVSRDLKSNVSGFINDFFGFESWDRFKGFDKKEVGTCGEMDIVVVNGQGDQSSNSGRGCLHFIQC